MQSYAIGLHSQHGWVHSTTIMKHQSPVLWQVFDRLVVDFPGSGLTCMSKSNGFKKLVMFFVTFQRSIKGIASFVRWMIIWYQLHRQCFLMFSLWFRLPTRKDSDLMSVPLCCFHVFDCFLTLLMEHQSCKQWGWNRRALQFSEPECHTSRTCPSRRKAMCFWKQHFFLNLGKYILHQWGFSRSLYTSTQVNQGEWPTKNDETCSTDSLVKSLSLSVRAKTCY